MKKEIYDFIKNDIGITNMSFGNTLPMITENIKFFDDFLCGNVIIVCLRTEFMNWNEFKSKNQDMFIYDPEKINKFYLIETFKSFKEFFQELKEYDKDETIKAYLYLKGVTEETTNEQIFSK